MVKEGGRIDFLRMELPLSREAKQLACEDPGTLASLLDVSDEMCDFRRVCSLPVQCFGADLD